MARENLSGLDYVHGQNVLHRDVKPANILLDAEGQVKTSDFGIARKIGMSRLTRTGYIGTLDFSSPEQVDAKRVDHRADLWAVGMLAYLLFTGRHPLLTRFKAPSRVNGKAMVFLIFMLAMAPLLYMLIPGGEVRREKLRSQPTTVRDDDAARRVFSLNSGWRPQHYTDNQFEDHGDGTVSDRATGLMWQRGGSDRYMDYPDARHYVKGLNDQRFGGHSDWRLPTVDELCSLLTSEE